MTHSPAETGETLDSMRAALADEIVERHHRRHPELDKRYGERGRQKCREDASYHLRYLVQSLTSSKPALFRQYVSWAKVMLAGRGISARDLADNLQATVEVLRDRLSGENASAACAIVETAMADLPHMPSTLASSIDSDQPLSQLAQSYLAALLACDRQQASRLILDAVQSGTAIKDVYIQVFQQTQHEIGRLWQINQITVAQEHYCTAVTQMIMSQLYPQIFAGPRIGRCFVGACVSGDLHEIGIRMVADFFEMDGWDTVYLGASIPGPDLIRTLQERKADVVGISATITPHIGAVAQMVSAVRAEPDCRNIVILVGGFPFLLVPDLWKQIGADGTCLNAQHAVQSANQLMHNKGII